MITGIIVVTLLIVVGYLYYRHKQTNKPAAPTSPGYITPTGSGGGGSSSSINSIKAK